MDFYPLIIRQNNSQVYYLLQYSIWFLEWIYDADILLIWIIRKSKNEQFWTGYFIYVYIRGHSISTWTKWECGGRGSKNVCFCWRSGYKNCPCSEGGGSKMAKFCPRSCWMTPNLWMQRLKYRFCSFLVIYSDCFDARVLEFHCFCLKNG